MLVAENTQGTDDGSIRQGDARVLLARQSCCSLSRLGDGFVVFIEETQWQLDQEAYPAGRSTMVFESDVSSERFEDVLSDGEATTLAMSYTAGGEEQVEDVLFVFLRDGRTVVADGYLEVRV